MPLVWFCFRILVWCEAFVPQLLLLWFILMSVFEAIGWAFGEEPSCLSRAHPSSMSWRQPPANRQGGESAELVTESDPPGSESWRQLRGPSLGCHLSGVGLIPCQSIACCLLILVTSYCFLSRCRGEKTMVRHLLQICGCFLAHLETPA